MYLLFESKKFGDYHTEMNGKYLKTGLKCSIFTKNSVIVMGNTPYHNIKLTCFLNNSRQKYEIVNWLHEKSINFLYSANAIKNDTNTSCNKYVIDDIAEKKRPLCITIASIYMLTSVELIWSQGYMAQNDKTFKLMDVKKISGRGLQKQQQISYKRR